MSRSRTSAPRNSSILARNSSLLQAIAGVRYITPGYFLSSFRYAADPPSGTQMQSSQIPPSPSFRMATGMLRFSAAQPSMSENALPQRP